MWYDNEDRDLIRNMAREFAETEVRPFVEKMELEGEYPYELVKRMGELGFNGWIHQESAGGSEGDWVTYGIILEEISKVSDTLALILVLQTVMCTTAWHLAGTDEQREKWLKPVFTGEKVMTVLTEATIPYSCYVFPESPVTPTEYSVGSAVMHFDYSCDSVIGIGSGVINDIGKILAHATGRTYMIVGTAPSMDGFASATSSMERDGLKVSLDSTFAWAIVGDTDILREAPMHMLRAGVGDMLAKYGLHINYLTYFEEALGIPLKEINGGE